MSSRTGSRPGGRSARIQQAVHAATRELLDELAREDLTIPRIAERADVDPTTIYRRWGTLAQLLSDVAADRIREAPVTPSTGSIAGDLTAWGQHYAEELSSGPGRSYITDVLAGDSSGENAAKCADYAAASIEEILSRFPDQSTPPPDLVVERVVAPLLYRLLFASDRPLDGYVEQLVTRLMEEHAPAQD